MHGIKHTEIEKTSKHEIPYEDLKQDEIPSDSPMYSLYMADKKIQEKINSDKFKGILGPLAGVVEEEDEMTKGVLNSVMKAELIKMTEENFVKRKAMEAELEQDRLNKSLEKTKEEPTGFFNNISSWWTGKKEEWAKPNASRGRFPADGNY